jgi:hypothetical protein
LAAVVVVVDGIVSSPFPLSNTVRSRMITSPSRTTSFKLEYLSNSHSSFVFPHPTIPLVDVFETDKDLPDVNQSRRTTLDQ